MSDLIPAGQGPVAASAERVALADDTPSIEELFTYAREAELRVQTLRMTIEDRVVNAKGEAATLKAGTPLSDIAHAAGHHDAFIRTRGQLAFLSPKIQVAILEGTFPTELTLRRIMQHPIPLDWQEQERICGCCQTNANPSPLGQ